jgi:hypothetical protein
VNKGSNCHERSQVQDLHLENPTNFARICEKEEDFQGCHRTVKNFSLKIFSSQIFSAKKIFTVEASINCRNNRWLVHDPDDVPVGFRIRFPASVCVFRFVSNEGDVMPPYIFQKG